MELIKGLGCVACVVQNWPDSQCEVHHVVEGKVRLGHSQTMGLCLWHHRGYPHDGYSKQQTMGLLGASLAHGLPNFTEQFGSQATLVAVQDYIIEQFQERPWLEFRMPRDVVLDIFYKWQELRKSDGTL